MECGDWKKEGKKSTERQTGKIRRSSTKIKRKLRDVSYRIIQRISKKTI